MKKRMKKAITAKMTTSRTKRWLEATGKLAKTNCNRVRRRSRKKRHNG